MENRSALTRLRLTRFFLLAWTFFVLSLGAFAQVIVPYQSSWKYATESNTPPPSNWYTDAFNDSNWKNGQAPLGFSGPSGPPRNTTLISGSSGKNYPVYYFRKTVTITAAETIGELRLNAKYDDGLVVYINGVQVASENMGPSPTEPGYYGYPPSSSSYISVSKTLSASLLRNGVNVIAVSLHQVGSGSSDIYFDMELRSESPSITRYPYLQLPSYDQMTVRWFTNLPTSTTVRYSTSADFSDYREYHSPTADTSHSATLKNLFYYTKYYYQVGYGSGDKFVALQNNPSINYFKTLPPSYRKNEPLRFWLLGDSGGARSFNDRPINVRDSYLAYLNSKGNPHVDGILFLGDNSNGEGFEGEQRALDTTLFRFYNRANDQQLLSHIPSWTVFGNHDYDYDPNFIWKGEKRPLRKLYQKQSAASFSTFSFPDSAQIGGEATLNKKGYYSFNQGDIHFVVLNPYLIEETNSENDTLTEFLPGLYEIWSKKSIALNKQSPSDPIDALEQVKWLKRDLAANTKKWTIVVFHIPPFSTIGHFEDELDLMRVREKLMPILEKPEYRVDAVLVSHTHAYLRAGMVRKNGASPRKTDFSAFNNLGRYPDSPPYIKTDTETAYTYILSGNAGRGYWKDGYSDGGYEPNSSKVKHPSTSSLPLDNLTGDNSTNFYHVKGGSMELLFQENRLDVNYIQEKKGVSPYFEVADSYVIMKDVNKKTTLTIQQGGDAVNLKASWVGDQYNWYSSESPQTAIASGVRELTLGPVKNTTFYVRDNNGYLADTFVVNVVNPGPSPSGDTLIRFNSQWLYPLSAGVYSKGIDLNKQCVANWNYTVPPFEIPGRAIIGLGHDDEQTRISTLIINQLIWPVERLWFRRSFILNGSSSTYSSFKLTLLSDKNQDTRKTYNTSLHIISINGQAAEIQSMTAKDIPNGRTEITYTLSTSGFTNGVNFILISYYITPRPSMLYPMDAYSDPFTFDAQLLSVASQLAPPPPSKQFSFRKEAAAYQQVCAGDSLNVTFSAVGNESGFPVVYEAQLVTATGTTPMAEGTRSPIRVKIPSNMEQGTYRIKIVTKSAFMDQVEISEVNVKVLPNASITPGPIPSIWKGQTYTLPLTFTGSGPWDYILSDGTKGTVQNAEQKVEVKPSSSTTYTIRSVSNSCGVATGTGSFQIEVKEPIIGIRQVSGLTTASQKNAICAGDSISIAYSVIGPDVTRTYVAELSDQQGSFTSPTTLGTGTTNPLLVKLPASVSQSEAYRIRIKAQNLDVDFTLGSSEVLPIKRVASASFTINKEDILTNEEVTVNLNFTGSAPWYYFLRYGSDTLRGNVSATSLQRIVTPRQTSIFSLDSVRNSCGYGLVSGNRTVTVTLVLSVNPLYETSVYPNPTSDRLIISNKQPWNGTIRWSITELSGKAIKSGVLSVVQENLLEIDVHSMIPGQYLLRVTEGDRHSTWKIIKN